MWWKFWPQIGSGVLLVQPGQILLRKVRYRDCPAFVDGFSDGQILILSAGCDQHMTFGTTRFYDCVVAGIGLVDK